MITVLPSYSLLDKFGMRATIVWSGSGVLALGCLLRCLSLDPEVLKWTSLLCGAMNGWSSIMIEATLTVLSLRWFPPGERTRATGVVIATQEPEVELAGNCSSRDPELTSTMKAQVSYILYGQAGISTVIFLLMIAYFPEAPPSPPSSSASTSRPLFKESFHRIFKSKTRILTGVAFACITVPMMWIAVRMLCMIHTFGHRKG